MGAVLLAMGTKPNPDRRTGVVVGCAAECWSRTGHTGPGAEREGRSRVALTALFRAGEGRAAEGECRSRGGRGLGETRATEEAEINNVNDRYT